MCGGRAGQRAARFGVPLHQRFDLLCKREILVADAAGVMIGEPYLDPREGRENVRVVPRGLGEVADGVGDHQAGAPAAGLVGAADMAVAQAPARQLALEPLGHLAVRIGAVFRHQGILGAGNLARIARPKNPSPQDNRIRFRTGPIVYNIPSQDLAKAINAYVAASGVQVLYDASLTAGRPSAAVIGTLSPEIALQRLLGGSGLVARRTDFDAITIAALDKVAATSPDPRFLGALQAGILGALCRTDETRPGTYRMALQVWFDRENNIARSMLLGSTGDSRRDAAVTHALSDLALAVAPPAGMAQPVPLCRARPRREMSVPAGKAPPPADERGSSIRCRGQP